MVYDADSFLEKNRDTFSANLREVMLNSQNEFIKDLFQAELAENGGLSRYAPNCSVEYKLTARFFVAVLVNYHIAQILNYHIAQILTISVYI